MNAIKMSCSGEVRRLCITLKKRGDDKLTGAVSFFVVAFQSAGGEIRLRRHGKEILLPIPPTYLDESTMQKDNIMKFPVSSHWFFECKLYCTIHNTYSLIVFKLLYSKDIA